MDNFNNKNQVSGEENTTYVQPLDMPNVAEAEAGVMPSYEEAEPGKTGFTLASDNGGAQPGQSVSPQSAFVQPGMYGQQDMNQGQGIPGVPPQSPYAQPSMYNQQNMNQGMPQPGMYNQQSMNPGMPQPGMYGQPGINPGMPPQNKPPKAKKSLSNGAIIGIISGGIVLIALIVCAILFIPKLFRSDKEVVVDAFANTFGAGAETVEADDEWGFNTYSETYAKNGGTVSTKATINSIAQDPSFGGIYVNTTSVSDFKNKLIGSTIELGTNDGNLVTCQINADEDNTYIVLDNMIDGTFVLPNDNVFVQLQNSPLGQAMELTDMPEINLNDYYFMSEETDTTSETEIDGNVVTLVEDMWDSITYEKQGKSKVSVNGKSVKAQEYYVTLGEEAIEDFLVGIVVEAEDEVMANPDLIAENGLSQADMEATMTQLKNLVPQVITGDLLLKVYIVDDEIVKITCQDDIGLYGVDLSYSFYLDIDDTNVEGLLELGVMEETVGIKITATNVDNVIDGRATLYGLGENIDVNFKFAGVDDKVSMYFDIVSSGTTLIKMDLNTTIADDNSFDGSLIMEIDEYGEVSSMEATFKGDIEVIQKGVSHVVNIDSIKLFFDGTELFDMSLNINYDNSKCTVGELSQGTEYDLITITEDDLLSIIENNQAMITSWAENFVANAGPIAQYVEMFQGEMGSDVVDPVDDPVIDEPLGQIGEKILTSGERQVEILGTISGFDFAYGSDTGDYISYETPAWSNITYTLYDNIDIAYLLDSFYIPEEQYVLAKEINQEMTIGQDTIYYSYVQSNDYDLLSSSYRMVKEVDAELYLVIDVIIYDDDETFTKEQVAEALNSQNYKILN